MSFADIKPQPYDSMQKLIPSISSLAMFAAPTMDGTAFKAITLTTDSKSIKIQAGNGVATDFTSFGANPSTFHFALAASPTVWTQHEGELNFDLVAPSGTVVGYVRAETGVIISVMVGS